MSFCSVCLAGFQTPTWNHDSILQLSLQSRPSTILSLSGTTLPFIKRTHLSHFAITQPQLFMGISFLSQSFRARGLTGKAGARELRFPDPANWLLHSFVFLLFLLSAPTCLQLALLFHCLLFPAGLLSWLLPRHVARILSSLFSAHFLLLPFVSLVTAECVKNSQFESVELFSVNFGGISWGVRAEAE